jgi:hypothetical protein
LSTPIAQKKPLTLLGEVGVVEIVEVVEGKRVGPIALVPPEQADTVMATRMTALLNTAASSLGWRREPISFRTDTPSSSLIGTEAFAASTKVAAKLRVHGRSDPTP